MVAVRTWGSRPHGMNWIRLSTRMAIYIRDGFDCVWCRLVFPIDPFGFGLTLDHIIPGAGHAPSNLITACPGCNYSRQHTPAAEFGDSNARARVRRAVAVPIDRVAGLRLARARRASRR